MEAGVCGKIGHDFNAYVLCSTVQDFSFFFILTKTQYDEIKWTGKDTEGDISQIDLQGRDMSCNFLIEVLLGYNEKSPGTR